MFLKTFEERRQRFKLSKISQKKNVQYDLLLHQKRLLESGLVISLLLITSLFFSFKKFERKSVEFIEPEVTIVIEDIPPDYTS